MPTLKINGQEVVVEKGVTVFQACQQAGIALPHYCYHPALSIAGNCRVCVVEINGRTMTSCSTVCADKMEVLTDSPRAREARSAVMEFLLLNHPLDCPVCDQAGDCNLQNFYVRYSKHKSRMVKEEKIHKEKRKPILPEVMLDQERCILCSRCVRFCKEITQTYELGIFQRGDHSRLDIAPEIATENAYSGNLVDICPVGALTDRNFRYSISAWFLKKTPSICPHCERGCSIEIHTNTDFYPRKQKRAYRIKPRFNPEVNGYWICDAGRYSVSEIDEGRWTRIAMREGDKIVDISWKRALELLADLLHSQKGKALLSSFLSSEELLLGSKLFSKAGWSVGCSTIVDKGFEDNLLRKQNRTPNVKMAEKLNLPIVSPEAFLKGERVAFIFHPHLFSTLPEIEKAVFFASHESPFLEKSWLILPVAVYAEKEGHYVNFEGKTQPFQQALPPLEKARGEWEILRDLYLLLFESLPELSFSLVQQEAEV